MSSVPSVSFIIVSGSSVRRVTLDLMFWQPCFSLYEHSLWRDLLMNEWFGDSLVYKLALISIVHIYRRHNKTLAKTYLRK
jgi:hypothetical protein